MAEKSLLAMRERQHLHAFMKDIHAQSELISAALIVFTGVSRRMVFPT